MDNLTVDPATGDILAGCHPNPSKLLDYNPEDPPGSEVSTDSGTHRHLCKSENLLR